MSRGPNRQPIEAAVTYARRGWPVFPCHQPTPGACGCTCGHLDCGSPGKHPRVAGGLNAATTDESQIRRWWSQWPHSNVAIRTGAPSGLVVIDIDPDHSGDDSLEALLARHGALPEVRTIRTGGGGRHLYFSHPGDVVRNDAGRRLGAGIDVRGDGGYVIAPPSRHRNGRQYSIAANGGHLPELPDWLLRAIRPPAPSTSRTPLPSAPRDSSAWTRAAVDGELARLRAAAEGTRNATLNRVAFRLGQIIGAGHLNEPDIEPLLIEHGIAIGLREREVVTTVHSGLRAGEGTPRGPTVSEVSADVPEP